MERDCIISAPQVGNGAKCFGAWKRDHLGKMEDFYRFMTTPTAEREAFIAEQHPEQEFLGSVITETI